MDKEEFEIQYNNITERAMLLSEKSRREGLLALEEVIDEEKLIQRDIFEWGIRLVVDGTDYAIIDKILSNIINLETNIDKKILKTVQKEAVLGIFNGENPRLLNLLLNSHVSIGIESAMKKYNEI